MVIASNGDTIANKYVTTTKLNQSRSIQDNLLPNLIDQSSPDWYSGFDFEFRHLTGLKSPESCGSWLYFGVHHSPHYCLLAARNLAFSCRLILAPGRLMKPRPRRPTSLSHNLVSAVTFLFTKQTKPLKLYASVARRFALSITSEWTVPRFSSLARKSPSAGSMVITTARERIQLPAYSDTFLNTKSSRARASNRKRFSCILWVATRRVVRTITASLCIKRPRICRMSAQW